MPRPGVSETSRRNSNFGKLAGLLSSGTNFASTSVSKSMSSRTSPTVYFWPSEMLAVRYMSWREGLIASWNTAGWFCTTAHGPDLWLNTQNAVRYMIDWLKKEHGLNDHEGLILCSTAMDLKISETVDAPNWIVSACMPLGIFSGDS